MKKKNILLSLGVGILSISTAFVFASVNQSQQQVEVKEASAATVEEYYADCEGLTGNALKAKLKTIISNNIDVSYSWSRYEDADEDIDNSNNIITIYARTSLPKNAHVSGNQGWNREHTFPQSKMGVESSKQDNHIVFASDCVVNGKRGNHKLGELNSGTAIKDSYGNETTCLLSGDTFDPGDTVARGLVARSTMYASVLYGYDIDDNITSYAKCLEWHFKYYPTQDIDIRRNNTVYGNQKNRNPFVDHPEYAAYIWGDHDAACQAVVAQYFVTLNDLTASGTLQKTNYHVGDTFDPTGLTITASFSNGESKDVTSEIVWEPSSLAMGDTSVTGTYTYGSSTKQVVIEGITVAEATGIVYTGTPNKTVYNAYDEFDPTGCEFFLKYSDESLEPINADLINWGTLVEGETSVTGTFLGFSVTVTGLTINGVQLTELVLSGTLTKTSYFEGETFDPSGLKVTASFSSGTEVDVTSQVTWAPSTLTAGTTSVTGTFETKSVTVTGITVKAIVFEKLELAGKLAKTVYLSGETFDPSGLIVWAVYNNAVKENVTYSVVWTPMTMTAETTEVVGTYQNKEVRVTGFVVNKPAEPSGEEDKPKAGGGCSASIHSNSSIVFITAIGLIFVAIRMAYKAKKDN